MLVGSIAPEAPRPRLLGLSQIVDLLRRFPSIVSDLLGMPAGVLTFDQFNAQETAQLATFVKITSHSNAVADFEAFLRRTPNREDAVFTVSGPPGIGKTRLVLECLRSTIGYEGMTLYCPDSRIALELLRSPKLVDSFAIVVVDDCSDAERIKLETARSGHADRVRLVVIDTPDTETDDPDEDSAGHVAKRVRTRVDRPTPQEVDAVLAANFPATELDSELRWSVVGVCNRQLRFAVDLCKSKGDFPKAIAAAKAYVEMRLKDDPVGRRVIQALGVFEKVDLRDEAGEIGIVAGLAGMNASDFRRECLRLKRSPGIVRRTNRYLSIRPEIVGDAAFKMGFDALWETDVAPSLANWPISLQHSFAERARHANEAIRDRVSLAFDSVLSSGPVLNSPVSLARIDLACALSEVDPHRYLIALVEEVEGLTDESLVGLDKAQRFSGEVAVTQRLAWCFSRMTYLREVFPLAERGLYRLARLNDSSRDSNHPRRDWMELWPVSQSGRPNPIDERLNILESRITPDNARHFSLLAQALHAVVAHPTGRSGKPGRVCGLVVAPEWGNIATESDWLGSHERAFQMLCALDELTSGGDVRIREVLVQAFSSLTRWIAHHAFLIGRMSEVKFTPDERCELLSIIDRGRFHPHFDKAHEPWRVSVSVIADKLDDPSSEFAIRKWFSREDYFICFDGSDRDKLRPEVDESAKDFVKQCDWTDELAKWAGTSKAKSARSLGLALGEYDTTCRLWPAILSGIKADSRWEVAFGYLWTKRRKNPTWTAARTKDLAALSERHPKAAASLGLLIGDAVGGLDEAIKLVQSGRCPVDIVGSPWLWIGERRPTATELVAIATLTRDATDSGAPSRPNAFAEIVAYAESAVAEGAPSFMEQPGAVDLVWQALERLVHGLNPETHLTEILVKRLLDRDAQRLAPLIVRWLLQSSSGPFEAKNEAAIEFARKHPAAMWHAIQMELEKAEGYRPWHTLTDVLECLSYEVVQPWLARATDQQLRAFAEQARPPMLETAKAITFSPLTMALLTHHGRDEVCRRLAFASARSDTVWYRGKKATQEVIRAAADHVKDPRPGVRRWANMLVSELRDQLKRNEAVDLDRD